MCLNLCTGISKFVVVARTLVRIGYKRTEVRTTLNGNLVFTKELFNEWHIGICLFARVEILNGL